MAFGVSQTLITNKKCKEKKLMKKILKKTSSVILALCIIFCMGINVQAATHKPGCAAKSTRLVYNGKIYLYSMGDKITFK